jgi:hypothetical protein
MKEIDFGAQTNTQLDKIISNGERKGSLSIARKAVIEKANRGRANKRQLSLLEWNQHRVALVLAPFVELSESVLGNMRKSYSEAGGGKWKPSTDPNYLWIDSYTGIKTPALNATMSCHVARPGDPPIFTLTVKPDEIRTYALDDLDQALREWQLVTKRAEADV